MKFQCVCGAVIRDQTDSLPYKAHLLPDEDQERVLFEGFLPAAVAYAEACSRGEQAAWCRAYFGHVCPDGTDSRWLLPRLLIRHVSLAMLPLYQCEACGRLWMPTWTRPDAVEFRSLKPEEGDWRGALASRTPRDLSGAT